MNADVTTLNTIKKMSVEEDISWKSKGGGARHLMLCFSPFLNIVSSVSLNCTSNVFLIH